MKTETFFSLLYLPIYSAYIILSITWNVEQRLPALKNDMIITSKKGYCDMDSISIMLFLHKNMFFSLKKILLLWPMRSPKKFFDDVLNFFAVFLISQEMTHHKLLPYQPEFYFQINIFW